jgi:hypothetical protein
VLCCAVLCCAVLCCAVLCCAELCCAVLCCAVLSCAVMVCVQLSLATCSSTRRSRHMAASSSTPARCAERCVVVLRPLLTSRVMVMVLCRRLLVVVGVLAVVVAGQQGYFRSLTL